MTISPTRYLIRNIKDQSFYIIYQSQLVRTYHHVYMYYRGVWRINLESSVSGSPSKWTPQQLLMNVTESITTNQWLTSVSNGNTQLGGFTIDVNGAKDHSFSHQSQQWLFSASAKIDRALFWGPIQARAGTKADLRIANGGSPLSCRCKRSVVEMFSRFQIVLGRGTNPL